MPTRQPIASDEPPGAGESNVLTQHTPAGRRSMPYHGYQRDRMRVDGKPTSRKRRRTCRRRAAATMAWRHAKLLGHQRGFPLGGLWLRWRWRAELGLERPNRPVGVTVHDFVGHVAQHERPGHKPGRDHERRQPVCAQIDRTTTDPASAEETSPVSHPAQRDADSGGREPGDDDQASALRARSRGRQDDVENAQQSQLDDRVLRPIVPAARASLVGCPRRVYSHGASDDNALGLRVPIWNCQAGRAASLRGERG